MGKYHWRPARDSRVIKARQAQAMTMTQRFMTMKSRYRPAKE